MTFSKIATAFALTATLLPQTASALSCIRPDAARSFQNASEASESYVVLYGTFDFTPNSSTIREQTDADPVPIPSRFSGQSLSPSGFSRSLDLNVTIQPICVAVWCGHISPNVPTLAFVQKSGSQYTLNVGPCGGWAMPQPTREALDQVEACMRGATCRPARPMRG